MVDGDKIVQALKAWEAEAIWKGSWKMNVNKIQLFMLAVLLSLNLAACGGGSGSGFNATAPLNSDNINLIFVVSPDLAYHAAGDVDPNTANLTPQGLHRSLLMAQYLKAQVLGMKNVTGIYALEPMTHLQTANNYPDMAALAYIQQFALQNQMTLSGGPGTPSYTGNSYPINVSYTPGFIPPGVATPSPSLACPGCQGLAFDDAGGNNVALVNGIITANVPGFYVFSAPWETTRDLMANINNQQGYSLILPASFRGPNTVYVITIAPSGVARFVTYDSQLNPPSTYPVLFPPPQRLASCAAAPFSITAVGGVDGVIIPAGINTNQTLYMVRHAEAHPTNYYGDGNYVGAGQWRALSLPAALAGKISPDQVYSIDPAQVSQGSFSASGNYYWSNVAPSLTVQPYAIANHLPYHLVTEFLITDANSPQLAAQFFFHGGKFTNRSVLLGWQFTQAPQTITALLSSYNYTGTPVPAWSPIDYDSIWTVHIDAVGNLTVDNALCEGIDSASLPAAAPRF